MCGICGFVSGDQNQKLDTALLENMNKALTHRGPDDSGIWINDRVGLGMRRLSVIDLSGGIQPMKNEDESVVLVFNGEIYNFRELRSDLEKSGHKFHTESDTEVVLRAYEQYGDDALEHFNGMFALAIYDVKRDRLLVARDRLGIKPLYYVSSNGNFAFASELDALLRSGLVNGKLNVGAVDEYLTYLYIPAPDTIFRDVHKLCPGEKLVLTKGAIKVEPYWQLEYKPDSSWTLDSAACAYRELLEDSVRLRLVSDVPLGAFLSGGLDSSSIVAMMSSACSSPVKTFTIGFDDSHADELHYARIAADHFGTDHTEEILRPDMVDVSSKLARHFGEPFADSSAVPMWLVSKTARQHVTVALSGDGGDELFAGYTWLHMNRKVAQYRKLPAPLRHLIDVGLCIAPRTPYFAKLRRFSRDSFISHDESFRRRQTCFNASQRESLYSPDMSGQVAACVVDRFQEHLDSAQNLSEDDRMLHQDTRMYLPDDILTKVDRMSMAVSLEARVPLLDHRLMQFAATVPFNLKMKGNTSKRVAKHSLRDVLPPPLLVQRKRGFSIPIQRWFREDLRDHFKEMVLSKKARCLHFFNQDTSRCLLEKHLNLNDDYGHHLWALLMFEHWIRYIETVPDISISY